MEKETLEEAAYRLSAEKFEPKHIGFMLGVIEGAKWQSERMYSEEDLREAYMVGKHGGTTQTYYEFKEWFEQFKKK